jgi:hypothetical protein
VELLCQRGDWRTLSRAAELEEMNDLLADELQAVKRQQVKTVTLFAFCVASAAIGLTAAPPAPLALGAAFLSVGQFGFRSPDALIALAMLNLGGHPPVLPGRR